MGGWEPADDDGNYVVDWHVLDHAEGEVFGSLADAQNKYQELAGGAWAARLYDNDLVVMEQYGTMYDEQWEQLDEWANVALNKATSEHSTETTTFLPRTLQPTALPSTTFAATSSVEFVVDWHVRDHAEGKAFGSLEDAQRKYDELAGGPWATRLYDTHMNVLEEYGWMGKEHWAQLDDWARAQLVTMTPSEARVLDRAPIVV